MAGKKKAMDISLRIKADAKQAVDSMRQVRTEIEKTQATATETTASTSSLGKSIDNVAATSKNAAKAVEQNAEALGNVSNAAAGASRSANAMGRSVSNLATNLAKGNLKGAATDAARFGGAALSAEAAVAAVSFAVVGTVVALGTFAVAMLKGEQETLKFNQALISTGNFAGATAGQLVDMTNRVGAVTGRYGDAAAALTALTSTGKFARAQLDQLTQTAVEFATMTGGKVADGVKFVDGLMSGNIQTIAKLDQQYHFLTATQLDEIQRLMDQGEQERALGLVQQVASKAVHDRAEEVQANAGIMIRAWDGVKSAASAAWAAMKDVGAAHSASDKLRSAIAELADLQQGSVDPKTGQRIVNPLDAGRVQALQSQILNLRREVVAQGFEQSAKSVNDRAETNAKAAAMTAEAWLSPIDKLHKDLDAAAKAKNDFFLVPHDSATTERFLRSYNNQIQQIAKTYDSATKTQDPKKPKTLVDRSAEQIARQAAAAQNALTQALIQQQAALSSTAAILAKYNATVEKANQDAATAKLAHGANAVAINGVRDGVIAAAAAVRDAALDKLTEKGRQAWEALKRSFETPAQVRVEDALKQIQQLNDMLEKGVITSSQYHDALNQIGQKSVAGALPQYQGVDAAVGGAYGELQKNYQAQTALDAAYQSQKLALDSQFDDSVEAQHTAHLAAMASLDENYKNENAKIEKARGTLQLNAASNLFGQLATLSSSHNKKIAAIGKAAAIAQTIIQTYQSATEAYAAMASIPYIGPALGVAAAAAAIAAGLANVAQIRSQNVGGYEGGGPTPIGPKHRPVGIVHAGEDVWSQADIARAGGIVNVERMRLRGYADGGFVNPLAKAPSPAQLGFQSPSMPQADFSKLAAANDGGGGSQPQSVRVVVALNQKDIVNQSAGADGERVFMMHAKANIPTLRAWFNGNK